ncbi:MAG: alpha/beta fold hydrolase [Fibrella sp.]|nr:alpha/beta fold hydrolase [Armatimonadota bacterium]
MKNTQLSQTLPSPKYLDVNGGRMAYVDQGTGPTVVLIHGTPTYSFMYRHLINALAEQYRVIAPDHIGFGRSEKPRGWTGTPEDHAGNLRRLLDTLEIRAYVLVVHDFGGPIGLGAAMRKPEQVRGLVLFNTWMWSTKGTTAEKIGRMAHGSVLKFLYLHLAFSARILLPALFAKKTVLTPAIRKAYLAPFVESGSREGTWNLAKSLSASDPFFSSLYEQRNSIANIPSLVLWGMKDSAFSRQHLKKWEGLLTRTNVIELPEAGHFPMEEEAEQVISEVTQFLRSTTRA